MLRHKGIERRLISKPAVLASLHLENQSSYRMRAHRRNLNISPLWSAPLLLWYKGSPNLNPQGASRSTNLECLSAQKA